MTNHSEAVVVDPHSFYRSPFYLGIPENIEIPDFYRALYKADRMQIIVTGHSLLDVSVVFSHSLPLIRAGSGFVVMEYTPKGWQYVGIVNGHTPSITVNSTERYDELLSTTLIAVEAAFIPM